VAVEILTDVGGQLLRGLVGARRREVRADRHLLLDDVDRVQRLVPEQ